MCVYAQILAYIRFSHWPEKRKENLRGPKPKCTSTLMKRSDKNNPSLGCPSSQVETLKLPRSQLIHFKKLFWFIQGNAFIISSTLIPPLLLSCFINDQELDLVKVRLLESNRWQQWILKEFWETRNVVYFLWSYLYWFVCNLSSCAKFTILSGSFLCYHLGHRSLDIFCWIFFVVCLTSLRLLAVESELFESYNSRL